ncbi:MAG: MG2 domain-containing protein, partial [Sphingobacteriaceae bacterium]
MVKTFKACIYIIGCLMLLLFFTKTVNAQELKDSVLYEKFKFYSKAHPSNPLFVHTDKTIYTNNETIWFCGYLLKTEASDLKDHTILSVALMREDDRKVTLHSKYLMQQGLSFGSFTLPDTVAPGNYQFIAYTNVLNGDGDPLALFTQSLTIKSITYQDFNAELALLDTVATNGFVRAKLTVALKELDKKERVSVTYAVNKHQGRSFTLKKGENNFIITIPQSQLNQLKPILVTSVSYKKKTQHLSVRLPEPKSGTIKVRFFPEGGNLTEGLENVVAWETRNSFDQPVAITGTLYRDGRPLDTISTNSYGAGKFKIVPSSKSKYTFKLFANQYTKRDSIYALPTVIENNIVLHLPNAVVDDILRLRLQSKAPRPVQVIVHDFKNIYTSFYTKASSVGKELSLILGPGVPKGITTVTVLDSENRPLAERLFFAHYDHKVYAKISFDKTFYKRKDSVRVNIKLSDNLGKPIKGVISLAAVQDNRIEKSKFQDIESYVYLTHNLGTLPQDPEGKGINNKEYLEDMLCIRGWRRYTWQDLISSKP